MQLSESVVEAKRIRLLRRAERTGKRTTMGSLATFLFGSLVTAVGTAASLIGLNIIPAAAAALHTPHWPTIALGGYFTCGGVTIWVYALLEYLHKKRCTAGARQHPQAAAYSDYPWNPKAMMKSPWSQVGRSFLPMTFFTIFLIPGNWWVWRSENVPLLIIILLALFDLGFLLGVAELIRRMLTALKYGKTAIEYGRFPFFTGNRVELGWRPPSGLNTAEKITFTLRCVEEWLELTGLTGDRSEEIFHDQLWAATRTSKGTVTCRPNRLIRLSFDIPRMSRAVVLQQVNVSSFGNSRS